MYLMFGDEADRDQSQGKKFFCLRRNFRPHRMRSKASYRRRESSEGKPVLQKLTVSNLQYRRDQKR